MRLIPLLLTNLALSSCDQALSNEAAQEQTSCAEAREVSTMFQPPAMAEGVFLQSLSFSSDGLYTGFRVFNDGRLERSVAAHPWMPAFTLPQDQIASIQKVAEGAAALALRYRPERRADDAGATSLQTRVGGIERVTVVEKPCKVEPFNELYRLMAPLLKPTP